METTQSTVRAALLAAIWQEGPLQMAALLDLGEQIGAPPAQVPVHLQVLLAGGLIDREDGGGDVLYGPALHREEAARRLYARLIGAEACRGCGCSEAWACEDGCWWVAPGLCSSCGGR